MVSKTQLAVVSAFLTLLFSSAASGQVPSGGPSITTASPLPAATAGTYYTLQLGVNGGRGPYVWAEAFTPPGITLSSAGVLSGTPTTPGDFAFTTSVTDSMGLVAIKLLKLTVTPLPLAIVTPVPIASGVIGVPYSQAFTATGGSGPIRWTTPAGSTLPKGFNLSSDGVLSGTPSAVGTFVIPVMASDASSSTSVTYQLTIAQPGGLALSAGSLAFTAFTFGSNPPAQHITLTSTQLAGIAAFGPLPFSAQADANWLTLTPRSGTTPGDIAVEVFPRLVPGDYSANINIAAANAPPKTVPVSLKVLSSPVSLSVAPNELRLYGTKSAAGPLTASLQLTNTGSGGVTYTANVVDVPGATLTPISGTVLPNATVPLAISVDTRSITAGYYRGRIEVNWLGGSASTMVMLQVGAKPKLLFSQNGGTANATESVGLVGPAGRSFSLLSSDGTPVRYSAKMIGSAPWLTLNSTGGTLANSPAIISYSIDPTGLTSNAYYARIRITSPDVLNSPQDYLVVLKVNPTDIPTPSLFPAGLAFVGGGSSVPAVQTFQVYTNTAPVGLQLGVNTLDGGTWLAAKSQAGTASARNPALVQVSVNIAGLTRGIYRGTITVYAGGASARSVSVELVVLPPGSENLPDAAATVTAGCTPTSLAVVQTALEGNFFLLAGFPGTVTATVLDDCGIAVPAATVIASFSNGDAPLALRVADPLAGTYSQTWVPNHPVAGLTTTVTATASGLTSSTVQIGGSAGPNAVPTLRGDGPLHIFNPRTGGSLAPGTLLQIYGSGLGNSTTTLVDIGGLIAPLLYVGDAQINAQLPFELAPGEYQFIASVNNALTQASTLTVDPITPGVAGFADGHTIAQHAADYSLITSTSPARPNEFVILYLAGMGPTVPVVATGDKSPLPPAIVTPPPTVMLDQKPVQVAFAGLSPGIIGVYQINIIVPSDARSGDLQLQVFQGAVIANTSLLPVAQ